MRKILLAILFGFIFSSILSAQTGCPGCSIDLPPTLPADTVYLPPIPDGLQGSDYDESISFRLPLTTTPVSVIDSTTPPGLPISKFEIVSVNGLPPGLSWEPNQWIFETAVETDGCIRICGNPLVTDSFVLTVTLKATVLFLTQETQFPLSLYIAPKISTTPGFDMSNFTGCGETTVEFTNNIPSNGNPGFSYTWDFGDGTSYTGENPPPHLYDTPGMYPVQYHATIDTIGYILHSVTVLDVECVDQLGIGDPDLYVFIENGEGEQIYNSSPAVNNTPLPFQLILDMPLDLDNYTVFVYDEDGGLKGSDDACGNVSFNVLSNDTLVSGGFTVVLNIIRPITELTYTDTVTVFAQPGTPSINTPQGTDACENEDPIVLVSSFGAGNQWYLNGVPIIDATAFIYEPEESGFYQVRITTQNGCTAISDSVEINYYPIPNDPIITAPNGVFGCAGTDTIQLMSSYPAGNQWWFEGDPVSGATGVTLDAMQSGYYQLVYTSAFGCVAVSDSFEVAFTPIPQSATYFHASMSNYLFHEDTLLLPTQYEAQWYFEGQAIPGANGTNHCISESGVYGLLITDLETGCTNYFEQSETWDPAYECLTGTQQYAVAGLGIYPVPAQSEVWIQTGQESGILRVYHINGVLAESIRVAVGSDRIRINVQDYPAGVYAIVFQTNTGNSYYGKLVKQ
ncbi:MAG: PKD domain-containing protein [Saprospiraceae bacterium]